MAFEERQHITTISRYKQDNKKENEWNELMKLTFNIERIETCNGF